MLDAMLECGKDSHRKDEKSRWKDFSLDLSGRDLRHSTIHASWDAVHNINFDGSDLSESNFEETRFENCSFRGAKLRNVDMSFAVTVSCDLTDADISGCKIAASQRQLLSTLNYKRKDLSNLSLYVNLADVDFSGFDLRHSFLAKSKFTNCDFTDANITGSYVNLDAEQLRSTLNYKQKDLSNIRLCGDLSGLSFAGFDLRGTRFCTQLGSSIEGCDFTDADISGADFDGGIRPEGKYKYVPGTRITKKQLYSTRSYKEKNLASVNFRFCKLNDFDFTGQSLGYFVYCDLKGAKFENATFSRLGGVGESRKYTSRGFCDSCNLTFEQFASTRTFKSKRLPRGFTLSDELRKKFNEAKKINEQNSSR